MNSSIAELYELELQLVELQTSVTSTQARSNRESQISLLEYQLEQCLNEIQPCDFEKLIQEYEKEFSLLEAQIGKRGGGTKGKGNSMLLQRVFVGRHSSRFSVRLFVFITVRLIGLYCSL